MKRHERGDGEDSIIEPAAHEAAPAAPGELPATRPAKMKPGLKFPGMAELASHASSTGGPPPEFASRALRLVASNNFADPVFLEELVESNLVAALCAVRMPGWGVGCARLRCVLIRRCPQQRSRSALDAQAASSF